MPTTRYCTEKATRKASSEYSSVGTPLPPVERSMASRINPTKNMITNVARNPPTLTTPLADLMAEAISRGEAAVRDKNPELPPEQAREVARKVGVGAIKYADLSRTRTQDYVFDFDQMLAFEGNTGPYLQYAYTRIQSIFRKAADSGATAGAIQVIAPEERALALKLLQFGEVVSQAAEDALPHSLCTYLYELASQFMTFYEACPILKEDVAAEVRASRLGLARQVAETLASGLGLLGIEVMERM